MRNDLVGIAWMSRKHRFASRIWACHVLYLHLHWLQDRFTLTLMKTGSAPSPKPNPQRWRKLEVPCPRLKLLRLNRSKQCDSEVDKNGCQTHIELEGKISDTITESYQKVVFGKILPITWHAYNSSLQFTHTRNENVRTTRVAYSHFDL